MIVSTISSSYIVLNQKLANSLYPLRGTCPRCKTYDTRGTPLTAAGVGLWGVWRWMKGRGTQKILGGVRGPRGPQFHNARSDDMCYSPGPKQSDVCRVARPGPAQTHMHACSMHSPSPAKKPVCLPAALAWVKPATTTARIQFARCDNDQARRPWRLRRLRSSTRLDAVTQQHRYYSSVLLIRSIRYMLIHFLKFN